jgi:hypothetical protein
MAAGGQPCAGAKGGLVPHLCVFLCSSSTWKGCCANELWQSATAAFDARLLKPLHCVLLLMLCPLL